MQCKEGYLFAVAASTIAVNVALLFDMLCFQTVHVHVYHFFFIKGVLIKTLLKTVDKLHVHCKLFFSGEDNCNGHNQPKQRSC